MTDKKQLVKNQFGQTAPGYLHSEIHAKGKDLKWLTEEIIRVHPHPLLALDIATGAGHTAFALSSCVQRVVGLDLTSEMVETAKKEAERLGIQHVTWMVGDAEKISFPDRLFDIVTCRIAAHHFPSPLQAFKEVHRLLISNGLFILIDNYVPSDPEIERLYNEIELLRDPSHVHVYTLEKWSALLTEAGFSSVRPAKTWSNTIQLDGWFDRAATPLSHREKVIERLSGTPEEQQQVLGYDPKSKIPELILRKCMWVATKGETN
ncbi:class I SAM-dependent methyltransferase [Paenactinomyces guangxiensis]|uniref:Class I SAM-dependent methyltransferase n=1 Tax=Paenactinomyces guangxiensis TaxID=1490290 RepID=A0A7W2AAB4_9BACL|nr:class I SAM-dependent methyltransferase [Paenactinomyces guangxiensis]MBA4496039.1 class I SAM-dependent methyltransferase [Paenactinomyces guangxiensis]MBH8593085.1 class I SAM-dependent methyltransferase [Paenactinomyces guangxiensis]